MNLASWPDALGSAAFKSGLPNGEANRLMDARTPGYINAPRTVTTRLQFICIRTPEIRLPRTQHMAKKRLMNATIAAADADVTSKLVDGSAEN